MEFLGIPPSSCLSQFQNWVEFLRNDSAAELISKCSTLRNRMTARTGTIFRTCTGILPVDCSTLLENFIK